MAMFKGYLYEALEYIVEAKGAEQACEIISDHTHDDWNEIDAQPLKLPTGVNVEEMYPSTRYTYLPA